MAGCGDNFNFNTNRLVVATRIHLQHENLNGLEVELVYELASKVPVMATPLGLRLLI